MLTRDGLHFPFFEAYANVERALIASGLGHKSATLARPLWNTQILFLFTAIALYIHKLTIYTHEP